MIGAITGRMIAQVIVKSVVGEVAKTTARNGCRLAGVAVNKVRG